MESVTEQVDFTGHSGVAARKGVKCIFCGLPTPLPAASDAAFETQGSQSASHVSIVRCEICGKEAAYLSREVGEFGDLFRARRTS
jgi:hypothetical protein